MIIEALYFSFLLQLSMYCMWTQIKIFLLIDFAPQAGVNTIQAAECIWDIAKNHFCLVFLVEYFRVCILGEVNVWIVVFMGEELT